MVIHGEIRVVQIVGRLLAFPAGVVWWRCTGNPPLWQQVLHVSKLALQRPASCLPYMAKSRLDYGHWSNPFSYSSTMAFPPLLLIAMAFIAGSAISHEDHGGTCGPFGLTTTSGILYSVPNGTQLPGNSWNSGGLEAGRYIIWDNGTITNCNGSLCEFRRQFSPAAMGHLSSDLN